MGKLIKVLVALILVVVVVLVAAGVYVSVGFDPNDYKQQLAQAVQEKTGRELSIAGDISLSLFPWIGVSVEQAALSNAAGFSGGAFAQIGLAQVQVKTWPLLRSLGKDIQVDTIILNQPSILLQKNKQGVTNWDDLTKLGGESEKPDPAAAQDATGAGLAAIAVGGIDIKNATVVWDDAATDAHYEVGGLQVTMGQLSLQEPVPVQLEFGLTSKEPQVSGTVTLDGLVALNKETKELRVNDGHAAIKADGKGIPGGKLDVTAQLTIIANEKNQSAKLSQLVVSVLGLQLKGNVEASEFTTEPKFVGQIKVEEFVPKTLFKALEIELPEMSDAAALSKAALQTNFNATTKRAAWDALVLNLDDTKLTGKGSVVNFAKPAVSFNLQIDGIDVDRYLPPPKPDQEVATPASAAAAGAGALPVETLRALNLNGSVAIQKLKAYNIRSTEVQINVMAKNGVLKVFPAKAKLYQGTYSGNVQVNAAGKTPVLSMNERVSGVRAGDLLKDMLGDSPLSGVANVHVQLDATGDTPDQLQKKLNGDIAFSVSEGVLKGVDIVGNIQKAYFAYNIIKGQAPPQLTQREGTTFADMKGTAKVVNGVISNNDLQAQVACFRVNGAGTIDLAQSVADYTLKATFTDVAAGEECQALHKLQGKTISIPLRGPLDKLAAGKPDLAKMLGDVAKQELQEKAKEKVEEKVQEKLQEKLKDKLGDDAGKLLKGLFN